MKRKGRERVERSIILGLATTLSVLYLVGSGSASHLLMAVDDGFRTPVGSELATIMALVGIIVINGLFVAGENAVDTLKSLHVRHVKEENGKGRRLQELLDHKARYIAACSLGSQTARLLLVFSGLLLAQGLALYFEKHSGWTYNFGSILLSALIIAAPVSLVNLIIGELVPKSYAVLHPHRVGLGLYRFIRVAAIVFALPASFIVAVANLLSARFGGKAGYGIENQAEEEIKNLVESAQETGEIEVDEKELLHSVFEFSDTIAREVMTPRVDLDAMPVNSNPADVVKVIEKTGHSRIPLYEETDDQIVGIVHAKDLLLSMIEGKNKSLRSLMRPALSVPESKNLHDLLAEMRTSRSQMAVVQDEFGGTAGIVTIEDIVEELVGDIVDEYDEEVPEVIHTGDGIMVDGKTHVDDVNDMIGAKFASEEFDTIGGFVFGLFGRQPKPGDTIEAERFLFTVAETDGRRISKLQIEEMPELDQQSEEAQEV